MLFEIWPLCQYNVRFRLELSGTHQFYLQLLMRKYIWAHFFSIFCTAHSGQLFSGMCVIPNLSISLMTSIYNEANE